MGTPARLLQRERVFNLLMQAHQFSRTNMQRSFRPFHVTRLVALLVACLVWSGCQLSTDAARAQTAAINGGDAQTAPVNTAFPEPLSVIVVDQYGFVMENVQITWAVRNGGGTLSAIDTRTSADGIASVVFTAGPTAGISTITATVAGIGTLNFSETAT
jgi:hypothetical protein